MKALSFKWLLSSFIFSTTLCLHAYNITTETEATKEMGYGDWYIHTDGELHFLEEWLHSEDVVFDVGANVGEWSTYALGVDPSIHLYSFEPLPAIFPDLKTKLSPFPTAQVFNLALSNQTGTGQFCFYDESYDFSALSSFYEREVLKVDHQPPKIIEVKLDTVSHFCSEHNIDTIDLLKIDAEGAEWVILQGARPLIEQNKIRAIQFEYGGCFVDAKTTLQDIFTFLSNNDYYIFRLKPNGLIWISEWNPKLENFRLSNYVAIKKEELRDIRIEENGL